MPALRLRGRRLSGCAEREQKSGGVALGVTPRCRDCF